ncbi:conserved exported hypothetical protein [Microbacterium sp. C448]|uniref:hypothetical protein n=1 Tax=Microbacterium sp. C448 TaxID=1177594 RepID=UPI0003DE37FD|nr:hypothetical protein [Microbacterium sp. C448]CDK00097.1 conserved exported hypothetical protein [Microbacterium sp. C448]
MSTDAPRSSRAPRDQTRGAARRDREHRRARSSFTRSLAVVIAALVVVGAGGAAYSLTQGPRVSTVAIDALSVAEAAGQRIVFTTNQPLAPIEASQVTIEPSAPFTIEASGRNVAVQFTYPLDAETEYTVSVAGVESASGGPTATISHDFETGTPPIYVLQRRDGNDDAVFLTNLTGDQAVPVFIHPQIEDYRASRDGLVVETSDGSGAATLTGMALDGSDPAPLAVPGEGTIAGLQMADHDGLVGYTYTDLDISATSGIESALYVSRLDDPDAEPQRIEVGTDPRVVDFLFVPQTSSLVVLTFDGQLRLVDTSRPDAEPVLLGGALGLSGIERGSGRVIAEQSDGTVLIDLTDLSETPLPQSAELDALGIPGPVVPTVQGKTLRTFTQMGEDGYPESQAVGLVDEAGTFEPVFGLEDGGDAVMQTCASPSGSHVAVIVSPDLANNPYDTYSRPLPSRLETHIVDARTGEEVTVIDGTDISWCAVTIG